MLLITAAALIVTMALVLIRARLGPSLYDRILAVNTFGTKTVLLIAVLGFLSGRPDFLDIALVYALINFIATIAVLKFFETGGRLAYSNRQHTLDDNTSNTDPSISKNSNYKSIIDKTDNRQQ